MPSNRERQAVVNAIRNLYRNNRPVFDLVESAGIASTILADQHDDPLDTVAKYGSVEAYNRVVREVVDRVEQAQAAIREGAG